MRIATQHGFHEWTNGIITLFFLEEDQVKFGRALKQGILTLIKCSCLALDENGFCDSSNWSNVRNKMQLITQIQRINQQNREMEDVS